MKRLFVLLVLAASCQAIGQSIVGLWSVDLVTMGNEEMTPNSKWIEFHADGTYRVHGHMNRVEHCGYDNSPREYWNFNINGDVLTLSSRPSEEKGIEEVYYFNRTHQF